MKANKQTALIVLKAVQAEAKPIKTRLANLVIKDKKTYDLAGSFVKRLKDLRAHAEAKKKTITDPLNEALKATRELFKPFEEEVALIEAAKKQEMLAWVNKQDEKRERLEEKLEQGSIGVTAFARQAAEVSTSSASSEARKKKTVVIEDENKIPREYMMPDMQKIKAALKDGKKIAGVKEVYEKIIAI